MMITMISSREAEELSEELVKTENASAAVEIKEWPFMCIWMRTWQLKPTIDVVLKFATTILAI